MEFSKGQVLSLILVFAVLTVAIPLTILASKNPTRTQPRAYAPDTQTVNRPPAIKGSLLGNTITCAVGQPCVAQLSASDPDRRESLTLSLDFIPEGVYLSPCTPKEAILGTQAECTLTGTPQRAGVFKILATVNDSQGATDSRIFSLNIR